MRCFSHVFVTFAGLFLNSATEAFVINAGDAAVTASISATKKHAIDSKLYSSTKSQVDASLRSTMLSRPSGPFFSLDRLAGKVAFGATVSLVTQLDTEPNLDTVVEWLSDGKSLALSIWDEDLTTDLGDELYRLQVMKLQFVTIQLQPSVDVKMWTEQNQEEYPVFKLQSVAFDPNVQLLPGLGVSAKALGIVIDVVGELRPTKDGRGVVGKIAFQNSGILPPPLRILPEAALKAAGDTISQTIGNFAVQSFKRGATAKYRKFRKAQV